MAVFSCVSSWMASISSFSFSGSTLAVASSRIMTGASFIMARAMESRWHSPPESVPPASPMTVSYPCGSFRMKSWQHAHAPDGKNADQCVCDHAAQGILPFSAECRQQSDERHQSKLKIQIWRKHGAQNAEQDKKQLRARVKMQLHLQQADRLTFRLLFDINRLEVANRKTSYRKQ